ncbi:MAG: S-(hydroxymethyl)mycothiol dehydrogenase [Actinomycetota bacterium]|nr:S-(hydroxymethyl)mycothiol dehydrogenase [Actinomycetota bacterium]
MPQTVRAVVAKAKGEPVSLENIVIPDPGPYEVVVRIETCGVCHTDLHYREGGINDEFPFLLGHEATGRVDTVGSSVTAVAAGDRVVLAWRAPCGRCRACARGRHHLCFDSRHQGSTMTLEDGTPLSPALGLGAFAEKTLVGEGACVKIDERADPAAAGLLGCGVMAGWGAAVNTAPVRQGDSVAVLGCGGVGDAAIAGALYAGARQVIAVDLDDRKLEWAKGFGATHTVNAGSGDTVATLRELTGGFGPDVVIDAVGRPETYQQAFEARDLAGTVVLVGVPTPQMRLDMPLIEFFGHGGALKSSWYGDCLPSRDFPLLIDLYLQGRFDLEAFVTERIGLGDVEEAFHRMERGEVLRSVVVVGDRASAGGSSAGGSSAGGSSAGGSSAGASAAAGSGGDRTVVADGATGTDQQ